MKNLLKKLPLPITGLMLGFAALGNLLQSYSENIRTISGLISFVILILIILKIFSFPQKIKEDLKNPVIASVFPTLSMTIILLSTYIKPFNGEIASFIWFLGIILHIILMFWFTQKFVLNNNYNIKKVFPSWVIPYVGIAAASVSSSAIGTQSIGKLIFWIALIFFIILLPIILKRIIVVKEIPEPAIPSIGILAAPASLCLAGYMNSFETKNIILIYALLLISQALYWIVIFYLPKILKLSFYPSYSGITFPLVISGIALKLTNGFLNKSGNAIPFISFIVTLEEIIAVIICIYVLLKYLKFLFANKKTS